MCKDVLAGFSGRFNSRKTFFAFVCCNYGIAITCLCIAVISFSLVAPFSIMTTDISATGSPEGNTLGWYWLSIALWHGGITMLSISIFLRRAMGRLQIKGTGIVSAFFIIGSTGTFMVGWFPSVVSYAMHLTSAVMAFGGFGLGYLVFLVLLCLPAARRDTTAYSTMVKPLGIAYCFYLFVVAGIMSTQGYVIFQGGADFNAFRGTFLSVSLWEWLLFFGTIAMVIAFGWAFTSSTFIVDARKNSKELNPA